MGIKSHHFQGSNILAQLFEQSQMRIPIASREAEAPNPQLIITIKTLP